MNVMGRKKLEMIGRSVNCNVKITGNTKYMYFIMTNSNKNNKKRGELAAEQQKIRDCKACCYLCGVTVRV